MRGGYKLINLRGRNILAITLALGIFGAINDSYDKHIILHDFKVGDEKVNDVCVDPVKTESGYIIYNVYGYDITIGESDEIEVAPTAMAKKSDIETAIGQAEITINQIDSGEATSGQVPMADGEGGTEWGNLPSGGGTKLYAHDISNTEHSISYYVVTNSSAPFTTISQYLDNVYGNAGHPVYCANDIAKYDGSELVCVHVKYQGTDSSFRLQLIKVSDGSVISEATIDQLIDTVTEL